MKPMPAVPVTTPNSFLQRLIGAMALDVAIYEEIEADSGAMWQAMAVVVLASVAAGIGMTGLGTAASRIPLMTFLALAMWVAWAVLTFEIGGRILPTAGTRVDVGQLLRTIGFSTAPGLLLVFGALPAATVPVFAISAAWMLITMIYGVKRALDYTSTARAVAVCLFGWLLTALMTIGIGLFTGTSVS
jgi:hypothetical protein